MSSKEEEVVATMRQIIDIEDNEQIVSSSQVKSNNSALHERRYARSRKTANTIESSSTNFNSSSTNNSPTLTASAVNNEYTLMERSVTTSALEQRKSEHYLLNPDMWPDICRRRRSLSHCTMPTSDPGHSSIKHSDKFMAQRVVISRAVRSATEFHNETAKTSTSVIATNTSTAAASTSSSMNENFVSYEKQETNKPSMDIDVHVDVVFGTSSIINHINLKKQKLMARQSLPTIRKRNQAIASNESMMKSKQKPKTSAIKLTKRVNNSRTNKQNVTKDETKLTRGKVQTSIKPKKIPKSRLRGVTNKKSMEMPLSRFTQTDHEFAQPCPSFLENKKCSNQLICPYLHSEFPCKYYYLGLECSKSNNCQFMHNGSLSEPMKDALRSHIFNLVDTSSTYTLSDADWDFLQQMRHKGNLWTSLQNFPEATDQNSGESSQISKITDDVSIIETKGQLDFLTPQQLNSSSDVFSIKEMQGKLNFLSPQQLECLSNNYNIRSRDELKRLNLGQLHQMGINHANEVSALMQVALNSNVQSQEEEEKQQQQGRQDNVTPITSEIIEVYDDDDDDEDDHLLVIDESFNESNGNLSCGSNEADQTQAFDYQTQVEEYYKNLKETNNVINSVQERLQNLKNEVIPNKEKVSELMDLYDQITRQEQRLQGTSIVNVQQEQPQQEQQQQPDATENVKTQNDNIVSTLPAILLCEVVHDTNADEEDCVLLIEEDEDSNNNNINMKVSPKKTEFQSDNFENGVESDDNLPRNNADEMCSVVESISNVIEGEIHKINDQGLTDKGERTREITEEDAVSAETAMQTTNEDTDEFSKEYCDEITYEQQTKERDILSLQRELSGGVTQLSADELSEQETNEKINSLAEVNVPKTLTNTSTKSSCIRKERPHLRSDSLLQNDETLSNTSNSPVSENVSAVLTKQRTYKPRRLKIPKPKEMQIEKSAQEVDDIVKHDEQIIAENINTQYSEGCEKVQKVIFSNRYTKKTKGKKQYIAELQKSDNDMTDVSVESLISALHGDDGTADINNETTSNDKSRDCSPQEPLATEDIVPASTKLPGKIPRNKVISLKIASNRPKAKLLKSRNITITKSTVRRCVTVERPKVVASSLSAKDSVSKCHRGKPYVALTKLKPQFLKLLQKPKEAEESTTASYTSITTTTTCNITNSSSSTTTATATSTASLDSSSSDTSHALGQKRSCLSNNIVAVEEEEIDGDDSECDLKTHHKIMRMDSMKVLRRNKMENSTNDINTMTQHISYQNDMVFEDNSTTDYYSSSDEKPSKPNALSTSSAKLFTTSTAAHERIEKQQPEKSDLRQQIENVSNKSDLQLLQSQEQQHPDELKKSCCRAATAAASIKTSRDPRDLRQRLRNEGRTKGNTRCTSVYVNIKDKEREYADDDDDEQQHHPTLKDIEENPNEKLLVALLPTTPTSVSSNNKMSPVILHSADEEEEATNITGNEKHHHGKGKGVFVKYENNANNKDVYVGYYKYDMVKRQVNYEDSPVGNSPIASPTYGSDVIASPSPVRGGGGVGLLVAPVEYEMAGEIDGRLTRPGIPYILYEIDLSSVEVNKMKNIDKLMKTVSLDPRIFRSHSKRITTIINTTPQQQTATHYQTTSSAAAAALPSSTPFYPTISPYDPRMRNHHTTTIVQQSQLPTHGQNALVCYNVNSTTAAAVSVASATPVQHFMPSTPMMHLPQTFVQAPIHQQTPNMILYECIQSSAWYQSLTTSSKMQVNQSTTQLVAALNNFHRERLLNPAAIFNIFKLDSAIELLENMNNLGIYVDENGIIGKKPTPSHSCSAVAAAAAVGGVSTPCSAVYKFIQHVLDPSTPCTSTSRAVAGTCNAAGSLKNEQIVSCCLNAPKTETMTCCVHKSGLQRTEQSLPTDGNYNDNRRCNNDFGNSFRQQQRSYNNQRFQTNNNNSNNNARFSKLSSYSYGGGMDSNSTTTRSSSPQAERFNRRQHNNGDGAAFNKNRRNNRNNFFNNNSSYGNKNNSPTRSPSSSYEEKRSSPQRTTPPLLSPRPTTDRQQSPVLNSPAKQQQKYQASTDEECWD